MFIAAESDFLRIPSEKKNSRIVGQGEIVHLRVSICSWCCARHLKDVCLASDSLEIMPGSSVELSEAQWSSGVLGPI